MSRGVFWWWKCIVLTLFTKVLTDVLWARTLRSISTDTPNLPLLFLFMFWRFCLQKALFIYHSQPELLNISLLKTLFSDLPSDQKRSPKFRSDFTFFFKSQETRELSSKVRPLHLSCTSHFSDFSVCNASFAYFKVKYQKTEDTTYNCIKAGLNPNHLQYLLPTKQVCRFNVSYSNLIYFPAGGIYRRALKTGWWVQHRSLCLSLVRDVGIWETDLLSCRQLRRELTSCVDLLFAQRLLTLPLSCSFSTEEHPHIIYEIRMRRPVQENIYTLD